MGQGVVDAQLGVHVPVAYSVGRLTLAQVRLHHAVILGGSAFGHFVVGNVGNLAEQGGHLLLSLTHGLVKLVVGLFHGGHLLLDGFGFVALAFLHKCTYLGSHLLGF